jgi:hypothetical protein
MPLDPPDTLYDLLKVEDSGKGSLDVDIYSGLGPYPDAVESIVSRGVWSVESLPVCNPDKRHPNVTVAITLGDDAFSIYLGPAQSMEIFAQQLVDSAAAGNARISRANAHDDRILRLMEYGNIQLPPDHR